MSKRSFNKLVIKAISSLSFVVCSAVSFLLMYQTTDSRINVWSNHFNNYYSNNVINPINSPFIRIQSNEKRVLSDLENAFYYTNSSTVNSSFRHFCPEKTEFTSYLNKTSYPVSINKQPGQDIRYDKEEGPYYFGNGLFYAYFTDQVLPWPTYKTDRRFKTQGICFISDSLADKLVEEYQIKSSSKIESYKTLMLDENYAKLSLKLNGEDTGVSFCINNILYSEERTGPRVQQLYGDFCIAYGDSITSNNLYYCAEFDMKSDIYGNTTFLKQVNYMGYNKNNASFSFFKYNGENNAYFEDIKIKNEFYNISFNNDSLYVFGTVLCSALLLALLIIFRQKYLFTLLIVSSMFLLYNFVLFFIFVPPLCNLPIFINFLIVVVFSIIIKIYKYKKTKQGQPRVKNDEIYI